MYIMFHTHCEGPCSDLERRSGFQSFTGKYKRRRSTIIFYFDNHCIKNIAEPTHVGDFSNSLIKHYNISSRVRIIIIVQL